MIYCCYCNILPTALDAAVVGSRRLYWCQGGVIVVLTAFAAVVRGSKRHVVEVDGRVLTKALNCVEGQQAACRSVRASFKYTEYRVRCVERETNTNRRAHHLILKNSVRTAVVYISNHIVPEKDRHNTSKVPRRPCPAQKVTVGPL